MKALRKGKGGFTLIELVVVITVLIALSALLVPAVSGVLDDSKVAEIAATVNAAKTACAKHYHDTGTFPREYCGSYYLQYPQHRQLSANQTYRGWRGPYLEEPIESPNPWNGGIHLYNYALVNGISGWDLDYDGSYEITSQQEANVLWMSGVDEEIAESIDEAIDPPVVQGGDWRVSGRVQYNSSNRYCWVMVFNR